MRAGLEVRVLVQPEYHQRYGLKLVVQDIDPAFTLGKLAGRRQENIQKLRTLDLLERNKNVPLPRVLQRIAVISSERAAGYRDFQTQLLENPFNYDFFAVLLPASMQGELVEKEVIQRLQEIERKKEQYDCIIIIRGGGAKTDLLAFDGLALSKAIAACSLPVLTGIGHDVDESVVDIVAHRALKTPTAVADFILHHNAAFEAELLEAQQYFVELIADILKDRKCTDHALWQSNSTLSKKIVFLSVKWSCMIKNTNYDQQHRSTYIMHIPTWKNGKMLQA